MSKYLLEIGVEELPYKFIPMAISQLEAGFKTFLESNNVAYKVSKYGDKIMIMNAINEGVLITVEDQNSGKTVVINTDELSKADETEEREKNTQDDVTFSDDNAEETKAEDDSNEEAIRTRLSIYDVQTSPLVEYYESKGVLKTEEVSEQINRLGKDAAEDVINFLKNNIQITNFML